MEREVVSESTRLLLLTAALLVLSRCYRENKPPGHTQRTSYRNDGGDTPTGHSINIVPYRTVLYGAVQSVTYRIMHLLPI